MSENPEVEADTEHDVQLDRGPSPTPLDPPPSTEDFEDLTIREELAYVKPILSAIMTSSYSPARERHNGYLKGGKARQRLVASAAARGAISVRDVDALDAYIRRWAMRKVIHAQAVDLQETWLDGEGLEVSADRSPRVAYFDLLPPEHITEEQSISSSRFFTCCQCFLTDYTSAVSLNIACRHVHLPHLRRPLHRTLRPQWKIWINRKLRCMTTYVTLQSVINRRLTSSSF